MLPFEVFVVIYFGELVFVEGIEWCESLEGEEPLADAKSGL